MFIKDPLKLILANTRSPWGNEGMRPTVRENFAKMIRCRTPALGANVFASELEERIIYFTCKSRTCPSCGHRLTILWQRELWASLPDIPYRGIVFTMPDVLWPIFKENRHLLHDLPVLGAGALKQWFKIMYGVSVQMIVVPHTFGRHLNFNTHLHILVSAGGLRSSDSSWIPSLGINKNAVMRIWKNAVITFLLKALEAKVLKHNSGLGDLRTVLHTQSKRWWSIDIDYLASKAHFLRYAARYIRRPPIAQHRFLKITHHEVEFLTNDLRKKRPVKTQYSTREFVAALAEHVPDRYRHGIRYFGLLAPNSKGQTSAAIFTILGQRIRPKPKRLNWALSLQKTFGSNPLIDSAGQPMRWVKHLSPVSA